ncbi:MAG TPA: sensor histidine kinase [Actinomycetota bacterium]|nr:sensor histidine kinase [Actinomycetota bacterium]
MTIVTEAARRRIRVGGVALASLAALVLAGFALWTTYERARAGHRAELLFAELMANAHRHSAAEWQAVAEGELSVETLIASDMARSVMTHDLEELSRLGLPGNAVARVRDAYLTYRTALEDVYELLVDGDIAGAESVHRERAEPAFRRLEASIETALPEVQAAARDGERAVRAAVALLVAVGAAAVLASVLFASARRRSELLALGRRAAEEMAAERRRLLEQAIAAAERERVLVANDLHDGPLQRLTSLTFKLERAAGRLRRGEAAAAAELLGDVQQGLADEIASIRQVMRALRPPVLEERGLDAALREHARALEGAGGPRCTVQTDLASRLSREVEIVLYRVAQEAIANAIKHAGASNVRVSVLSEDGTARLVVQDDGVGFEPRQTAELVRQGHYGLASMRERVEMAGGSFMISSRPGAGTTLEAVLPNGGDG